MKFIIFQFLLIQPVMNIFSQWSDFRQNKKKFSVFIVVLFLLAILLAIYPNFLNIIETRQGVVLNDPILNLIPAIDLTWLTFAVLYLSLIYAVISYIPKPEILLTALVTYSLIIILRIAAMYFAPFEPPQGMITLNDPFVELFGTGKTLSKDLFFSGHTSMLFFLSLIADTKNKKIIFFATCLIVGTAVIVQHVHYTIDVLAAIVFSYSAYKMARLLLSKLF